MKRRHWQLGLAGVVGAVVIGYGVWTVENVRSLRSAEAAIRDLKAAGFPTRLEDLRALPPPAENAAPLYQAAHGLYKAVAAPEEAFTAVEEYPPRVTGEDRRLLPACEEALALVHQAGRLPACAFQIRFEDGFSALIPHLAQLRELSRVLGARALARGEDGRVEEALDDLHAIFAMSRALRAEPLLISQLVRARLSRNALLVLEAILPRAPSAAAALERAGPDTLTGALATGLRGEIANLLSLLDPAVLARYRALSGIPREFTPSPLAMPGYRAAAAACARLLGGLAGTRGEWADLVQEAEHVENGAHGLGLFASFVSSSTHSVRFFASVESRLSLARLAALFLDHRRVAGSYPESIEALSEARNVLDPLTGKPFAVHRDGEWLVLHNVEGPETRLVVLDNVDLGPQKWRVEWRLPAGS